MGGKEANRDPSTNLLPEAMASASRGGGAGGTTSSLVLRAARCHPMQPKGSFPLWLQAGVQMGFQSSPLPGGTGTLGVPGVVSGIMEACGA